MTHQYMELKLEELEKRIEALEHEPKSEWEHDHEILNAYSDGASDVLDKIRAEIDNDLSDGMIHKKTVLGIIDKYKAEWQKEKRDCKTCDYSKDGHYQAVEECHICMWSNNYKSKEEGEA